MVFGLNVRFILLLCAVILSLVLIVYSWLKGKKSSTLNSYLTSQLMLFIWSLSQILQVFTINRQTKWVEVQIEYLAICYIGFCWLIFCLRYTESKFVNSRRNIILLFILPTLCYLSVLTNQYHHLFFKYNFNFSKREIIFWIHTLETYIYCFIGTVLLIVHSFKQYGNIRKQIFSLVLAVLIPIIVNLSLITEIFDPGFDITPLSFMVSLPLIAVATFKYKLLNTESIALRNIVNNMKMSILVTDNLNLIKDYNLALIKSFAAYCTIAIGGTVNNLVAELQSYAADNEESRWILEQIATANITSSSGELSIVRPVKKCFAVNIQPVINGKDIIGRVISFNDISDFKNLWEELNHKNSELSAKNQQLENYAETVAELAVAKERNRFARDVHDTIGQTMTLLITLIQIAQKDCRTNPPKVETRLDEALKIANEGLAEVRRSLIGLAPENIDSLKNSLQSLADNFQTSGMKVDLVIDDQSSYHNLLYSGVIYRICQEALTNALRHGKASHVAINLKLDLQRVHLVIVDNGHGCKDLIKGFGLCGMEQRITNLNGNILYEQRETGFGIQIEIPVIS